MTRSQEPRDLPERARAPTTQRWIFGVALALLAFWVTRGFVLQIAFAVILTVAVWPLYRRVARSTAPTEQRIFLPLAFTVVLALILILPLAILGAEAVRDSAALGRWLVQASRNGVPTPAWLGGIPVVGGWLSLWWNHNLSDPHGAAALLNRIDAGAIAQWIGVIAGTVLSWTAFLFVTLLAFLVIIRDGSRLGHTACRIAGRLYGPFGERFVSRLAEATRGTVNGTVFIAVGEGLLIGIGYAVARLPHPLAFTVATIGFALVPFGAWAAFGVASSVLVFQGASISGALLFGYSSVVMLVGDNLVQPALIGNSIRLPFLWTFVGIFGGMYSFGLVGLFIGPVIMAMLFLLWCDWQGRELPRGPRRRRKEV
jgi:predicted PurR-regulated permease PerM